MKDDSSMKDDPERQKPGAHLDLSKEHKKLTQYYDDFSEHPVEEARIHNTYTARHKASGEYRSIRIVSKKNFSADTFGKQLETYKDLLHPNVLHLYETLEDRKSYYFITDRIDNPNIYQAIPKLFPDPSKFDEVQVALLVRRLLRTLEYCHSKGFPHTDLNYHNILVDPKRGLKFLYIVGFGYARLYGQKEEIYSEDSHLKSRSNPGYDSDSSEESESERPETTNIISMAPEDLFAAPETRCGDLSVYDNPSDIWSVGIITYQLLTRHHPFEDPNVRPAKFQDIEWKDNHFQNHPHLEHVSPQARDFMKQLLTHKDWERPTATQALEHEWLRSVDSVKGTERKEALRDCLFNLQNFDAENKLEHAARLYIAKNLLRKGAKESLDSVFRHLDTGKATLVQGITREDLKVALEKVHGKDKNAKVEQLLTKTFDRVDVRRDGIIDYAEFVAAAADDSILLTRRNLKETFDFFDKSKTGTITKSDLKELCKQEETLKRRDARRLMRELDLDKDGEISFDEFCEFMQRRGR